VTSIKSMLFGKNVHRTPKSLRGTGFFTVKLCHYTSGINAHTNRLNVVTVSSYHFVFYKIHCMQGSCKNSFLAIIQMQETTNLLLNVNLRQFIFKLTPEQHIFVPLQVSGFGNFLHLQRNLRPDTGFCLADNKNTIFVKNGKLFELLKQKLLQICVIKYQRQ